MLIQPGAWFRLLGASCLCINNTLFILLANCIIWNHSFHVTRLGHWPNRKKIQELFLKCHIWIRIFLNSVKDMAPWNLSWNIIKKWSFSQNLNSNVWMTDLILIKVPVCVLFNFLNTNIWSTWLILTWILSLELIEFQQNGWIYRRHSDYVHTYIV